MTERVVIRPARGRIQREWELTKPLPLTIGDYLAEAVANVVLCAAGRFSSQHKAWSGLMQNVTISIRSLFDPKNLERSVLKQHPKRSIGCSANIFNDQG